MPKFIDYVSVEPIPGTNKAVAFINKASEVFREDSEFTTRQTPDGDAYVPWGDDDYLPYHILDYIESDETLATCQVFNAEVCYGSGLEYNTANASKEAQSEVEDFILDNPLSDYFLGVCQDFKHFNFAISVVILNADASKIVEIHRKPACYCRFAPIDERSGKIEYVIYGQFRSSMPAEKFEKIALLDTRSPFKDLMQRVGRRPRANGKLTDNGVRKFAILSRFPGVDSLYYPIPHYAALFKGSWWKIKQLIGINKLAKLQNAKSIKYVIEISPRYWENIFQEAHATDIEARKKIVNTRKQELMKFVTSEKNAGSVLFTGKSLTVDGKNETPDITVQSVDSKTVEGGDWESDIAEAINMVCFTMRVHSNLVGSVPGKAQTNNSGSDKRELYTIAQALQKPYHDLLFNVHRLIIRFNEWQGVYPDCPFMQLTTLDEHTDAKTVTNNTEQNAD
jgi:hypothetical protein